MNLKDVLKNKTYTSWGIDYKTISLKLPLLFWEAGHLNISPSFLLIIDSSPNNFCIKFYK